MKNYISNRFFVLLLSGTMALSTLGCSTNNFPLEKFENAPQGVTAEFIEAEATSDIAALHQSSRIIYQSEAKTYAEIYKDVDKVKELVRDNQIITVYLDLDSLFTDDYKTCLLVAKAFLEKCKYNNINVELIGSKEIYEIIGSDLEGYKACLRVDEDVDVEAYTQAYSAIYDERDSKFYTNEDDAKYVEQFGLNNPDNFRSDTVYVVQEGDSVYSIAEKYGLSHTNLMAYNNMESADIYPGDELIIPNDYMFYTPSVEEETYTQEEVEEDEIVVANDDHFIDPAFSLSECLEVDTNTYYRGIDVSEFQRDIDWDEAAQKIDFAIIRITDAGIRDENGNIELDSCYKQNIEACNNLGIPVGIYIYSRANTEEEMNEEIRFVLEHIKDYNITLPIYRDLEGSYAAELLEGEEARINQVKLTEKFCSAMEEAGYPTGLYLHKKYLDCVPEIMNKYSIWAQGGMYYSTPGMEFDDMKYAYDDYDQIFDLSYGVNIFQPTECGSVEGLGITECEGVDYDYVDQAFVNALIKKFDKAGNVKIKRN